MKTYKLITALLLMVPAAAWAAINGIPEPDVLPLLAVGGVVAVAIKFMKGKK